MIVVTTKKEEKILFKDIRNVDKLLDYMVTESATNPILKYEILEQKGNLIRYWPYPRYSILKILDKPLIMLAPKSESLTLHFDGNVVYMRGIWFSVNKLKKQLKLLELF